MNVTTGPRDIARRLSGRSRERSDGWRRETFTLPRHDARAKAREWFDRYPKAAYMTEIEFWRELDDGRIEFIIRRLPSAD
jgi:PAS domain-containing protein